MTISSFFGLLLLMAGALALGQTPTFAPASSPVDEALTPDAQIERAIRARFAKSKISKNDFTVRVSNGVAILRGRADIVQHKGVATRLARLAGAKRVDNRIEITERARSRASRKSRSSPRRVRVRWPGRSESERR